MSENKTLQKLIKICGMLGSAHDGERAAAALLATQIIGDLDLSWSDIISAAFSEKPEPKTISYDERPAGWHLPYCEWLLTNQLPNLSKWDVDFIRSLYTRYGSVRLTKKQADVIVSKLKKYGVEV